MPPSWDNISLKWDNIIDVRSPSGRLCLTSSGYLGYQSLILHLWPLWLWVFYLVSRLCTFRKITYRPTYRPTYLPTVNLQRCTFRKITYRPTYRPTVNLQRCTFRKNHLPTYLPLKILLDALSRLTTGWMIRNAFPRLTTFSHHSQSIHRDTPFPIIMANSLNPFHKTYGPHQTEWFFSHKVLSMMKHVNPDPQYHGNEQKIKDDLSRCQ